MNRDARTSNLSTYALTVLVFAATYAFSKWILQYYIAGDQAHYSALYESLKWANFSQINDLQEQYTGSTEPFYGMLMWVCASFFDKDVVISFANSILMSSIFIFIRNNKSGALFTILIFTNYYVLVILTSAERLKFAYIFAIIVLILPPIWRILSAAASLTSHYSIIIIFISVILPQKYLDTIKSFRKGGWSSFKSVIIFAIIIFCFIAFCILYRNQISSKVLSYESYDVTEMVQGVTLLFIAMVITSDRWKTALTLSFPLAATFVLGGDRVNMLTISVFIYLVLREDKTRHPLVLIVMGYLSFKSINFVQNVFAYGTGFLN